jgi:hypothetical protein
MRFFWEMGEGDRENEATKEKVGFVKWNLFFPKMGMSWVHKHVKILHEQTSLCFVPYQNLYWPCLPRQGYCV